MAIAFINSASNSTRVSGTNIAVAVTYSSTSGNTLVLFAGSGSITQGVVVSVIDSNSTHWTQATTVTHNPVYGEMWYITNSPAITSVTVTYTGGGSTVSYAAGVSEFSGVGSAGTTSTNVATSQNPTISQNITGSNNWIVATNVIQVTGNETATIGNLEYSKPVTSGALTIGQGDNTSASVGSVTVTFHNTTGSAVYGAIAMELLLPSGPPPGGLSNNSLMLMGCGI